MQRLGAQPSVVFVLDGSPLSARLDELGMPNSALKLPRGRAVVRARRRLARVAGAHAPDVVILAGSGYLAASLRSGGFGGPIIGTEHGVLLQLGSLGRTKRWIRTVDRLSGVKACSALVAVSRYMEDRIAETRFAPSVICIPNGIDLARFTPDGTSRSLGNELLIGCASRLIEGKGVEDAIAALARPPLAQAALRIAGAGPLEASLRELARSLDVEARVEFSGSVLDMPAFWRSVEVAVVPSNQWIESFGMVALEPMACAKPVAVTRNGALPSLVKDGQTGMVVPPADIDASRLRWLPTETLPFVTGTAGPGGSAAKSNSRSSERHCVTWSSARSSSRSRRWGNHGSKSSGKDEGSCPHQHVPLGSAPCLGSSSESRWRISRHWASISS